MKTLLCLFALVCVAGSSLSAQSIGGVPMFPSNNVWNTPVDALPAERAIDIINDHGGHNFHPDFGTVYQELFNGIPVNVVSGGSVTPVRVNVTLYASESDALPGGDQTTGFLPIPANLAIEGDPPTASTWDANADHHLLLIDSDTHTLHELYNANRQPDGSITAKQYSRWDLNSNALRPEGITSTDAAGLPVAPGLIRYDDVQACLAIDPNGDTCTLGHALRFTLDLTHGPHRWPARHDANSGDTNNPPLGLRVRLKASVDTSAYSPTNRVILNTLKKYGALLADNGGDWFFQGSPDPRWNDEDVHLLSQLVPSDTFEVVNTQNWIVSLDSGEANPNGSGPPTWPKAGTFLAIDFDDVTTVQTAPGFTSFGIGAYSSARGYGWQTTTNLGTRFRNGTTDPFWRDIAITEWPSEQTFLVDLPNGSYDLTLFFGDSDYPNNQGVTVSVEGVLQFTLTGTSEGQQLIRTVPVTVTDGQMAITFGPAATGFSLALAGLEIDPVGTPPPPPPPPPAGTLTLTDTGTGVDQVVVIDSVGLFRLVFEAADNWGLSQWYDLVNDPTAQTNLIGPAFGVNNDITVAEPGLFQQVFYGTNPDDPKAYIRAAKYYFPTSTRTFEILENIQTRIIVRAASHPIAGSLGVLSNVTVTVTYEIYPNGKILIHSEMAVTGSQYIETWFNSIMGLENPGGLGEVPPDTRGWIRATATQNPYSYVTGAERYVFAYWSPQTPAPYTDWAKASVLLVPAAGNPYQGKQIIHSWTDFMRWGYGATVATTLTPGQTIVQDYMLQLGTSGSTVLPDITSAAVADPLADAYLSGNPPPPPPPPPPSDTEAPVVSLQATIDSRNNVTATATATDNVGVTMVEFYLDGALKSFDQSAPYTAAFKLGGARGSQHPFYAKAYDAAGNVGQSQTLILVKN